MLKSLTVKKYLLVFASILSISYAQSFYDMYTMQNIQIYFGFSDWDYRMDTANTGADTYTIADSVIINGTKFNNVGVKFKGNSTYDPARAKNPLHIKLDEVVDQDYQGYEDIKLNNGFYDATGVREVLSYHIARKYMNAPNCNYAQVYINGAYYGIFANAQDINNKFLLDNYYSSIGTFIKCNPQSVGVGSGSALVFLDTTITPLSTRYELKNGSWLDLHNLCDTIKNYTTAAPDILDIDRVLWMLAFNNVLVNLDSYSGSFRQNYYMYENHDHFWIPTLWDLNMSFGRFSDAGGTTGSLSHTGKQNMSPTLHKAEDRWPLIYYFLNNPFYEKMYFAHMRTINNENFAGASPSYKDVTDSLRNLIDVAVSTDANFFYTLAQYASSLTTNLSTTNTGLYVLMDSRTTYLSGTTELSYSPPVITSVTPSSTSPAFGTTITITANVTNRTNVYLGYRYHKADRFIRIPMFDDGAHNDGAAGDNVYGADITINSLDIQYYIYAENANAGMFSPERAEHEFYTLTPTITMATGSEIVINEFLADNESSIMNEQGKTKDWVEIYNLTSNPLGLGNLYLTDSVENLSKWRFPANAFILPNEYKVIWADDKDLEFVDLHTNFNLSSLNEEIVLSDGTSIVDSSFYPGQSTDISYARCYDATGAFDYNAIPTPRAENNCVGFSVEDNAYLDLSFYPNPATDWIYINDESLMLDVIEIISIHGQIVASFSNTNTIPVSGLAEGMYQLRCISNGKTYVGKWIKK